MGDKEFMKVIMKKIDNINQYSIIRYSMSGIIIKTIILIILYLLYIGIGLFRFNEIISNGVLLKFIIGSFLFFVVFYIEAILSSSKEVLIIEKDFLILKNYILFLCYKTNIIKVENIKKIYWESIQYRDYPILFFPTDLLKTIKFKVKDSKYEDKIYAFGYKMNEYETFKLIEEIESVLMNKKSYTEV